MHGFQIVDKGDCLVEVLEKILGHIIGVIRTKIRGLQRLPDPYRCNKC